MAKHIVLIVYIVLVVTMIVYASILSFRLKKINKWLEHYKSICKESVNQRLKGMKPFRSFEAGLSAPVIDRNLQQAYVIDTIMEYYHVNNTFNILVWDYEIISVDKNGNITYDSKEDHPQMTALMQECSLLNIKISYILSKTKYEDFKKYLLSNDMRADEILEADNVIMGDVSCWSRYQLVFLPNAGISSAYEILVGAILRIKSEDSTPSDNQQPIGGAK